MQIARMPSSLSRNRVLLFGVLITSTSTLVSAQTATTTPQTTAITDCHQHGATQYCIKGNGEEVQVLATATGNTPLPTAYTDCHAHGEEMYCIAPDGGDVAILDEHAESEGGHDHDHEHSNEGAVETGHEDHDDHNEHEHSAEAEESSESGGNCHFHAGVEHCTGDVEASCERRDRDYNVPLRIGLLFVVLATSAIAVYAPILMRKLLKLNPNGIVFTIVKQFGTGIIIATAMIHLLTHAELMWSNSCLGELKYEATSTAIAMAGAFLAFLIDFTGHRFANWRRKSVQEATITGATSSITSNEEPKEATKVSTQQNIPAVSGLETLSHHHDKLGSTHPNDALSVLILEAGIIFHSLLLGITLVVAGDSVFITLFIVIVFHQMFEGLALGARIAAINGLKKTKYILLPLAFAFVTPTGMAIGIGVLNRFNGNDPATIIALGTLDSLSAGILLWVGFVSMWASDWMFGELRDAGLVKTLFALVSLVAGMILMGLLGKWA